ncbi:hypothetical protein LRS11_00270 [Pseudomonas sp. J452]|uniref:hypothetical protein n=1 Tax=Pseudomonas sp. J452 TaxID=2898441 RepID=UPI0021AD963B|nr:hypothetical protein [Pseudomonas sp. J452]UUY08519.1 hypothetical protein LRS11_00270 [Pseudomonas sp. J452]
MPVLSVFLSAMRLMLKANYIGISVGVILAVALSSTLSAYFGGRQPATVALDVGFSTIRILLPLLLVFLVQDLFSREFDKRFYLGALSYPHLRWVFLVGRVAAILVGLLLLLLVLAVVLAVLVELAGNFYPQATPVVLGGGYVAVFIFMALDFFVLTAVAVLVAMVASTPSFVMIGTFGFMLVARSYASIIDLLTRDAGLVVNAEGYRAGLGVLGYLLPDLGALDIRMLALYGKSEFLPLDWPWLILSNFGYALALLGLAIWVFERKRFS